MNLRSPFPAIILFLLILTGCKEKPKSQITISEAKTIAEKKFKDYLPKILKSNDAIIDVQQTHTGDFTGDGIDDIAIYFTLIPKDGASAIVGQGLSLYRNTGTDVEVIAGYDPKDLFTLDTIAEGKIKVELMRYAEGDGWCCPSIKIKHTLKIKGNKAY